MTTVAELRDRFAPLFETIAAGALTRERDRSLPEPEVRALAEAGFGPCACLSRQAAWALPSRS